MVYNSDVWIAATIGDFDPSDEHFAILADTDAILDHYWIVNAHTTARLAILDNAPMTDDRVPS